MTTKKEIAVGLKAFEQEAARLHALIDQEPQKAINDARALSSDTPVNGVLFIGLKAAILIDAGACTNDTQAIEEGISLFRKLIEARRPQPDFHYNLGNGLMALADQQKYTGRDWYLITAETRREARNQFQQAVSPKNNRQMVATALTNLGNSFWKAYRWVEAYDAYLNALSYDPSNAIASTGAAKILLHCVARGIGDMRILKSVADRHVASARKHSERIAELAGTRAKTELSKILQRPLSAGKVPGLSRSSKYEKFVALHRLALSPTIEGLDCSLERWDSIRFGSISESNLTDFGVPPLFAMLNVMKADFLAARYLAFQALTGACPESGWYADTLDYAKYGVAQSMLCLAQRACIDVLDKVAVATSEYFSIPGSPKNVYFSNRWFADKAKDQPLAWHPSLAQHIDEGNTALVALTEVSLDVREGGALHQKRMYRHSSTHRFTVLHDHGAQPSRDSAYVDHCTMEDFKSHLVESLQLARAAILYFVEMVSINEAKTAKRRAGKPVPLIVPSHHQIRGDDGRTVQIGTKDRGNRRKSKS